jgi:hypothetical protein
MPCKSPHKLLETLLPCPYMANLIKFEKIDNNGAPFDCFPAVPNLPMAS